MPFNSDEVSVESAQPIECYLFSYGGQDYTYTSSQYQQILTTEGIRHVYNPEYIRRGDNLKLGDSGGTVETCTITVSRTNSIALLYQGSPPELSSVRVQIFRVHGENNNDYIRLVDGTVSQVKFSGSEAELTVTIENILNRYIPRGSLSYYCQNCIYDEKCQLNSADYAMTCYLRGTTVGLTIYSNNLLQKPSGYFSDGFLVMGNSVRAIVKHDGDWVRIKYPINRSEWSGTFTVYPGCSNLFKTCAERFGNTDNFNGIPYIQPYDAFKHPVDKGAYWVDGNIVYRDTHGTIYSMTLA